jgi:hypothetical protein
MLQGSNLYKKTCKRLLFICKIYIEDLPRVTLQGVS